MNHAELGATGDFGFFVRTRLKGGATGQFDVAPADGYRAYTIAPPHIEAIGAEVHTCGAARRIDVPAQ